jgi:hypothetical protein
MDVSTIHSCLPGQMASLAVGSVVLPQLPALQASPRHILRLHGSHNGAKMTAISRMVGAENSKDPQKLML